MVAEEATSIALKASEKLVLAAIAYLQPVIRLSLSRVLCREVSRDMIARLKRLELPGAGPCSPEPSAPVMYVITPAFLARFGRTSLRELPDIDALEDARPLEPGKSAHAPSNLIDAMLWLGEEA